MVLIGGRGAPHLRAATEAAADAAQQAQQAAEAAQPAPATPQKLVENLACTLGSRPQSQLEMRLYEYMQYITPVTEVVNKQIHQ